MRELTQVEAEAVDIIRKVNDQLSLSNNGIPIDLWFEIKEKMIIELSLLAVEIAFKHCDESRIDFLINVRQEIIKLGSL